MSVTMMIDGREAGTRVCSRCGDPADATLKRCKKCAEYNKKNNPARATGASGEGIQHLVTKELVRRKRKPSDTIESIAKELGQSVEWVKSERKRLTIEFVAKAQSDIAGDGTTLIQPRAKREAKRKHYGWKQFTRTGKTRPSSGCNRERAIAKSTKPQRDLERWVMRTGVWRLFSKSAYYLKDHRKDGGLDFGIYLKVTSELVALVDAKSEMKTTEAQDRQIETSWKEGIKCYLIMGRTRWMELTTNTARKANGSIWG